MRKLINKYFDNEIIGCNKVTQQLKIKQFHFINLSSWVKLYFKVIFLSIGPIYAYALTDIGLIIIVRS